MKLLPRPTNFLWDKGNELKNESKHKVSKDECEEVFTDSKKKIARDIFHSSNEDRFIILGKTKRGRLLFVVFTMKDTYVRIISARDVNRKERPLYEKTT